MAQKEIRTFKGLWRELWAAFHRGRFTKRAPAEEGLYAVWGRDGLFRGYVEVFEASGELWYVSRGGRPFRDHEYVGRTSNNPAKIHVGWWWSEPLPHMPAAPDWDGSDAAELTQLEEANGG